MKRIWLFLAFIILFSVGLNAQPFEPAALPEDPAVKHGSLPCGIKYYFAPNLMSGGIIDFTLVQKMDPASDRNSLISISRDRFSRIPNLEAFYARNGMRPSRNGYLSVRDGVMYYTVSGLSSARSEAVMDSTLLSLFLIMRHSAMDGQPSSSQAIIVSGDYDYDRLLSKMKTLSLIVPGVKGEIREEPYIWEEPAPHSEKAEFEGGAASRIVLRLKIKRMPDRYMNTLLPVMSDKMAGELEWVLRNRLYPLFRSRRLVVNFDFEHIGSSDTSSDEQIVLTVRCARSIRDKVRTMLGEELDRLYTYGVEEEEYCYAREANRYRTLENSENIYRRNADNIRLCASSFLYGGSLASAETRMQLAYRETPDSLQTRIFNSYLSAVFRQSCIRDTELAKAPSLLSRKVVEDSLAAYTPQTARFTKKFLKDIRDNYEYITGGVRWQMPNGVNVIYCQKTGCSGVWWSLTSRGGRKWADPDFFSCIDGIPESGFKNYLESQGITVKLLLNPVDVTLEGKAPSEKMENALQILSALVGQKENSRVFAPNCYKLFVMVGEQPASAVKELLCKYSYAFGPGAVWSAGDPYYPEGDGPSVDLDGVDGNMAAVRDGIFESVCSRTDISSWNTAVAKLSGVIMRQRLNQTFCGCGCVSNVFAAFQTFPTGMFYMDYGVIPLPVESFAIGERTLSEPDIEAMLMDVLRKLSVEAVDEQTLAVARKTVLGLYASSSKTPSFTVRIARDRYMDNKDLYTKFSDVINSITPETIRKFFAGLSRTDSPER